MRGDDSGRGGEAVQVERGSRTSPVSAAGPFARVSEAAGPPEVESEPIDLAVAGLVTHLPGGFGGWA